MGFYIQMQAPFYPLFGHIWTLSRLCIEQKKPLAMASNLMAMASYLKAMASNGLQPESDGLQPTRFFLRIQFVQVEACSEAVEAAGADCKALIKTCMDFLVSHGPEMKDKGVRFSFYARFTLRGG